MDAQICGFISPVDDPLEGLAGANGFEKAEPR
jgi:hypothetical protein